MKEDIDYGTIPGTNKPTLLKPGAEKVCALFQLAPVVHIIDQSTPDTIRFQVKLELVSPSGVMCGEGVGAASSAETKYQWRASLCDEEFMATPEDRRRIAFKKGKQGSTYKVAQVRTEPEDTANTILKMAKKRALIDAVLTVTACSDVFAQDLDDPDAPHDDGGGDPQPQQQRPTQSSTPSTARSTGQQRSQAAAQRAKPANPVSEAQVRRFHAIASNAGKKDNEVKAYLFQKYGSEHASDLSRDVYDAACDWAGSKTAPAATQAAATPRAYSDPTTPEPDDYNDEDLLEPNGDRTQF